MPDKMKRRTFLKTTGLFVAGLLFAPIKALIDIDAYLEYDIKNMLPDTYKPQWSFAAGDAITRKMWAKKWREEAQRESYFMDIIGTSGVICPKK